MRRPGMLRYHRAGRMPDGQCGLCCQTVTSADAGFSLARTRVWHEPCWFAAQGLLGQRPAGSKALRRGTAEVLYLAHLSGGTDVGTVHAQLSALRSNPVL